MINKSLYVDPKTGGYDVKNGKLVKELPILTKANNLLSIPYGSYTFNKLIGNKLLNYTGPTLTSQQIRDMLSDCLSYLTRTGDLAKYNIAITRLITGKTVANISLYDSNGNVNKITWSR